MRKVSGPSARLLRPMPQVDCERAANDEGPKQDSETRNADKRA